MDQQLWNINAEIEDEHWWFTARRRIITRLASHVLRPSKTTLAVDIGCGTGGNTHALSQLYRTVGTDTSSYAVALARQRFPAIDCRCGDSLGLLGEEWQQVSLVLLADVLEHIEHDVAFFRRLVRSSRPGTFFLITVPGDPALWSDHDVVHHHFRRYTAGRLQELWRELPMNCLLLSRFNSRLYPLIRFVRACKRLFGTNYSDLRMPPRLLNRMFHVVFSDESRLLIDLLDGRKSAGFRWGVSHIALLQHCPPGMDSDVG